MQRALGRSTDHLHALAGGGVIERVPQHDEPLLAYVSLAGHVAGHGRRSELWSGTKFPCIGLHGAGAVEVYSGGIPPFVLRLNRLTLC
jgi:hypothetical protein